MNHGSIIDAKTIGMKHCLSFAVLLLFSATARATTIYECRAYNGSSFFSSAPCGQHKAIGVLLHTAPDGIPFEQQVKLLEAARSRKATSAQREEEAMSRQRQCAQIDDELRGLQHKYTSWQYVPVSEVNTDQARERDLKSRRSQLQCYSR